MAMGKTMEKRMDKREKYGVSRTQKGEIKKK